MTSTSQNSAKGMHSAVAPAIVKIPEVVPGGAVEISPGCVKQKLLQPDPKFFSTTGPAINLSQSQEAKQKKPSKGALLQMMKS